MRNWNSLGSRISLRLFDLAINMCENLPKYLEDPKKYCSRINSLLDQNSAEWQNVWKAAIPELSTLAAGEISIINALLKPIESAFKSKDGEHRVQAFECWSVFIDHCETVSVSDKLWNVLLVPLLAHNHSLYPVLEAKLKTWDTFVSTSFTNKPQIMNKTVSSILKLLYGSHTLPAACNYAALVESCGKLYNKLMEKCSAYDNQLSNIFSYLEHAIPPLSNLEKTRGIAYQIWTKALDILITTNWREEYFEYLMRTLNNLLTDDKNKGYHLLNTFLSILFKIHEAFPSDRLTPHLNLIIKCLYRSPAGVNKINDIMNGIIKCCENPCICFFELDRELVNRIDYNRKDVDLLWNAMASCYTKWLRSNPENHDFEPALKILLFPFNHLREVSNEKDRWNCVMRNWKICFEECAKFVEGERFLQKLLELLEADIDSDISRLIVATFICNSILAVIKISHEPIPCKRVLLKISKNLPDKKLLMSPKFRDFTIQYMVTVKALTKLDPSYSKDFSDVMKTFDLLNSKNTDEVSGSSKSVIDDDCTTKSVKEESNTDKITTPIRRRSCFGEKLSSPATKKPQVQSPAHVQTTPKTSKIDDDDIQVVEIKPKSKNSPMTQHQLEKAKSKCYIPPMYEDLSQSQSQSLSQCESEFVLSGIRKPSNAINADLFEENANLPSVVSSNVVSSIPPILSFHSDVNSSSKKSASFLSKKSLFNHTKGLSRENSDSDCSVEVINVKKSRESNENNLQAVATAPNDCEVWDKQTTKRKVDKDGEIPNEVTPTKRSKRLSTRKSLNTPLSAQKLDKKLHEDSDNVSNSEPAIIDLAETESENIFISSNGRFSGGVHSPSSSLMSKKNDDCEGSMKRRSLRTKKNITPSLSERASRKRKESALESDSKQCTDSNDNSDEKKIVRDKKEYKKTKSSNSTVHVIVAEVNEDSQLENVTVKFTLDQVPCDYTSIGEKSAVVEENSSAKISALPNEYTSIGEKSAVVEENSSAEISALPNEHQIGEEVAEVVEKIFSEVTKSPNISSTDSIILVENYAAEVISVDDSGSLNADEKSIESKNIENPSDDSTFFEDSDQNVPNKVPCEIAHYDENLVQSEANSNSADIRTPTTSPEVISSIDSSSVEKNGNSLDTCANQDIVESNEIQNSPFSSVLDPKNDDTSLPEKVLLNLAPLFTKENVNGEAALIQLITDQALKDQVKSVDEEISLPSENCDRELKLNDESVDKRKKKDDCDNISSIHGNSRGSQLTKMAQSSNYLFNATKLAKTRSPKPGKSRIIGKSQGASGNFPSPTVSRAMKMFENKTFQTTPTKSFPMPQEEKRTFIYTPKECISPGILKKTDGIQNISSPRSPKVVNFADNLTHVKYFENDEESDSDGMICTEDKLSNDNLLNNAPLRSQDMLYSPLKNCRDPIQAVLGHIFSSAGSTAALEHFQRININTVGDLASMSTLSANSIPAGDNRIRRLRRALKKYNECTERDGRRRSARRRILKSYGDSETREVSCLIDLFNDAELADSGNATDDENDVNGPPVVQAPDENKTENNQITRTEVDEEAVVSNDDLEKPNLKPIDSAIVLIEDCNLVKKIENKENVDPSRLDVPFVEIVPESDEVYDQQVEPMEVEERPCELSKATNEIINESADYVCTDSNSYEQSDKDKRSITVHNIHRYSTGIESSIKKASSTVPSSTETASFEAVIVSESDNSTNGSVSIFSENDKKTQMRDTSDLAAESVTVPSSSSALGRINQENEKLNKTVGESISMFAENEIVTSTEKAVDSQSTLHSPAERGIFAPCELKDIANNCSDTTAEDSVSKLDYPLSVLNQLKCYEGSYSWVDLMRTFCPFYVSSEDDAEKSFIEIFKKMENVVASKRKN